MSRYPYVDPRLVEAGVRAVRGAAGRERDLLDDVALLRIADRYEETARERALRRLLNRAIDLVDLHIHSRVEDRAEIRRLQTELSALRPVNTRALFE